MVNKIMLLAALLSHSLVVVASDYKSLALIVEKSQNPKMALDKLIQLIEKNPSKSDQKFFSQALTAIATKFPCSGYFLSYNLPVEIQKQFETWYEDYSTKNPQEQVVKTIMEKMSTYHQELARIAPAQVPEFIGNKTAEYRALFGKLKNLGVDLNRVVFCEELDHNFLTYAFTKDLDSPKAAEHLVSVILNSSPDFNLKALDSQGKTFFGASTELYFNAQKETRDTEKRKQLAQLVKDVKAVTDQYGNSQK